jgi:hypothetical protein
MGAHEQLTRLAMAYSVWTADLNLVDAAFIGQAAYVERKGVPAVFWGNAQTEPHLTRHPRECYAFLGKHGGPPPSEVGVVRLMVPADVFSDELGLVDDCRNLRIGNRWRLGSCHLSSYAKVKL